MAFNPATLIFDRAQTDITNKTAKGYFNVSDWNRILDGSAAAKTVVEALIGHSVTPWNSSVITATMTTIPDATDFNELSQNVNSLKLAAGVLPSENIRYTWGVGNVAAPTYVDINRLEYVLYVILTGISPVYFPRRARTNVAIANAGLTRNDGFRS